MPNTANALSFGGLALSTGNLCSAVQPGGSVYGLELGKCLRREVGGW